MTESFATSRTQMSINSDEEQPLIIRVEREEPFSRSDDYYDRPSNTNTPFSRRRLPVQYGPYAGQHDNIAAVLNRYKYYNKLSPRDDSTLTMPDHIVPDSFLISIFIPSKHTSQSSIVTIFAMWNTMVGTSLLSMPWAIHQAGFITSIILLVSVALLMFYTSWRIVKSAEGLDLSCELLDFSDICRHYLGKFAEMCSLAFSLLTLLGAAIVYWILITNFLYNTVAFIYVMVNGGGTSRTLIVNTTAGDVYCPSKSGISPFQNITPPDANLTTPPPLPAPHSTFWNIWHIQNTVPFFLIIIVLPLVNFKSPTFFTKFNSLGTISVMFLVVFVTIKAVKWGINIDLAHSNSTLYSPEFSHRFPSLTGVGALALFIHNCVLSVMRNQKHPQHNTRDLGLAYMFVTLTYLYIGVTFYISFPTDKSCIADNLLNNILSTDILAFAARVFLVIQLTSCLPLLLYIFRAQVLNFLFGAVWPSLLHVLVVNLIVIAVCALFACFLPHIGKIIGFVGAWCGFAYAMLLPCLVYLVSLRQKGLLKCLPLFTHSCIVLLGLLNFLAQFVMLAYH